jgi:hypothetical protein
VNKELIDQKAGFYPAVLFQIAFFNFAMDYIINKRAISAKWAITALYD